MLRVEKTEIKLKEAILKGEYRAGERLIEAELEKKYSVSRTVVREVLKDLNAAGLLTYIPQKGHSVRKFSLADIKNLYDVIILLEGYACEISIQLFRKKDISLIKEFNRKMKIASEKDDYRQFTQLNTQFHGTFSRITGNDALKEVIENLRNRILTYRYPALIMPNFMADNVRGHAIIIKSVERGDLKQAKLAMQKHIQSARDELIKAIEKFPFL